MSLQELTKSQHQIRNKTKAVNTEQIKQKLIELEAYGHGHTESIGGIMLNMRLFYKTKDHMPFEDGYQGTLALCIKLSEANKFIHSCDIDYDITFINQEDAKFSTRTTGNGYLQSSQGYPYDEKTFEIDLIRDRDAHKDKNGFIMRESDDGSPIFQLSVYTTVSNIEKVNFDLN